MMSEIHDTGPVTPRQAEVYKKEYQHGVDLFQRALGQSAKSDNPYQKEQFGEVMDKAMRVLNETAKELKRRDLMQQNQQISDDYKAYQQAQTNESRDKLVKDLDKAKKSIS